jgi:two-component system, NarL family, response regulator DesR
MLRLVLADEHRLVVEGLAALLQQEAEFAIVALAASGPEAVEQAACLRPDVVVMEVAMPAAADPQTLRGTEGIAAARRLQEIVPDTKIILLTAWMRERWIEEARKAGAAAYLSKSICATELVEAIRQVAGGAVLLSPPATGTRLTKRQVDVLQLMAKGSPSKRMAHELGIGSAAVARHVAGIYRKFGASDRLSAVREGCRLGYLGLDE